jgi:type IV secretion system protein TrbL
MQNLDQIAQTFQSAGERYMAIMQPFAERVFFALATIEIILTAYQVMFEDEPVTIVLGNFAKRLLSFGSIFAMIANAPIWFTGIIDSFEQIGAHVAGVPNLSPSQVFTAGLSLFQTILRGFGSLSWFHMSVAALVGVLAGLVMFASFLLIAIEMVLTLAETYIGMAGGILLLGFSSSRWTWGFGEGYLNWIAGVGMKLMFLYLMVGVGMTIAAGWNTALAGWTTADVTLPLTIMGAAIVFAWLAWSIPNTAAAITRSAVGMSLERMVGQVAMAAIVTKAVVGGIGAAQRVSPRAAGRAGASRRQSAASGCRSQSLRH